MRQKARRRFYFDAQQGKCCHCGREMTLRVFGEDYATWEHLHPVARLNGDSANPATFLLAHRRCNNDRGAPATPPPPHMLARAKALWEAWQSTDTSRAEA